jgi:hypothetical protein
VGNAMRKMLRVKICLRPRRSPACAITHAFAGFGGILLGDEGSSNTVSQTFTVTNAAGVSRKVTFSGREITSIQNNFGTDRVLGHVGLGLEYRFTPHIGLFSEAGYVFPDGASNNFVQVNCGLRFAF